MKGPSRLVKGPSRVGASTGSLYGDFDVLELLFVDLLSDRSVLILLLLL